MVFQLLTSRIRNCSSFFLILYTFICRDMYNNAARYFRNVSYMNMLLSTTLTGSLLLCSLRPEMNVGLNVLDHIIFIANYCELSESLTSLQSFISSSAIKERLTCSVIQDFGSENPVLSLDVKITFKKKSLRKLQSFQIVCHSVQSSEWYVKARRNNPSRGLNIHIILSNKK